MSNPPEQAPALKEIYEARLELVRQNEREIAELRRRLKQATENQKELVARMVGAKANYEEASSKIVELLDDDDNDNDNDNETRGEADASSSTEEDAVVKRRRGGPGTNNSNPTKKQKNKRATTPTGNGKDRNHTAPARHEISPSRTPSPTNEDVVDLVDTDDGGGDGDGDDNTNHTPKARTKPGKKSNGATQLRARSSSTNTARGTNRRDKEESIHGSDTAIAMENTTTAKQGGRDNDNDNDKNDAPTANKRPRASSTSGRGTDSAKPKPKKAATTGDKKKRGASSSTTPFVRKIGHRSRPGSVPPERWLKSSIGRSREELNKIDDMVQYMGSCKFGKNTVHSKFGRVHAVVLNDESNRLVQRNDEVQRWHVAPGPGRKRDARLVGASQSTIPIFHAPRVEYSTKELFYVGHYMVMNLEEFDVPITVMEKECDTRITFAFHKFDERLDSIINRGPTINC